MRKRIYDRFNRPAEVVTKAGKMTLAGFLEIEHSREINSEGYREDAGRFKGIFRVRSKHNIKARSGVVRTRIYSETEIQEEMKMLTMDLLVKIMDSCSEYKTVSELAEALGKDSRQISGVASRLLNFLRTQELLTTKTERGVGYHRFTASVDNPTQEATLLLPKFYEWEKAKREKPKGGEMVKREEADERGVVAEEPEKATSKDTTINVKVEVTGSVKVLFGFMKGGD